MQAWVEWSRVGLKKDMDHEGLSGKKLGFWVIDRVTYTSELLRKKVLMK